MHAVRAKLESLAQRDQLSNYVPYAKQRQFHALGAVKRVRALFGGNQTGKSICGGAETAMHLTGLYPTWWPGWRFPRPIRCWVGGETSEATRDNAQTKLLGPPSREEEWGTGFVPARCLTKVSRAAHGVANAIDSITVAHATGGASTVWFKRYDQGRSRWQGPTIDFEWFDEEPPWEIFSEGMTRTNAVRDARIILTFTALQGMSEVVSWLMGGKELPGLTTAG